MLPLPEMRWSTYMTVGGALARSACQEISSWLCNIDQGEGVSACETKARIPFQSMTDMWGNDPGSNMLRNTSMHELLVSLQAKASYRRLKQNYDRRSSSRRLDQDASPHL